LGATSCRAVVLSCIDHRFVEPLRRLLQESALVGAADVIGWPGGGIALLGEDHHAVIRTIDLACRLHRPQQAILTVHRDCGAIGGSSAFPGPHAEISALETSLSVAAETVADHFPMLDIRSVLLDERGNSVVVGDMFAQREGSSS